MRCVGVDPALRAAMLAQGRAHGPFRAGAYGFGLQQLLGTRLRRMPGPVSETYLSPAQSAAASRFSVWPPASPSWSSNPPRGKLSREHYGSGDRLIV